MKKIFVVFFLFLNINLLHANGNIIASIDNIAITSYDLNNYKKILTKENGLDDYLLMLKRRLIAIKNNVEISKQEKELLAKNKNELAKQLGIKKNLNSDFLIFVIESNYLWSKYVETILKPSINVTDSYIDNVVEYMDKENIKIKYNLSEIVLYYSNIEQKVKAEEKIDKIYKKLTTNNFLKIAKNYSQSLSAKDGGLMGWVFESDLNKDVISILKDIDGDTTEPICIGDNSGMCVIFKINEKEKIFDISHDLRLQIKNFIFFQLLENKIMDVLNNTNFIIKYYDNN